MVKEIEEAIAARFSTHRYKLYNSYVFNWESDYFSVTQDGKYIYEVEIKISRADFKADFEKGAKHNILSQTAKKLITVKHPSSKYKEWNVEHKIYVESTMVSYKNPQEHTPNRFYYACPSGLLTVEDIPAYAGLFWFEEGGRVVEKKKAPLLHKQQNFKQFVPILLDKFYFQWEQMRSQYRYTKDIQVKYDRMQREYDKMKEAVDLHNLGATIEQLEYLKKEREKADNKRYEALNDANKYYRIIRELCRKHNEDVNKFI